MNKKIIALLTVLCLMLSLFPAAFAATDSGTWGDNLTWSLDDEGTLTISGTGEMEYAETMPWFSHRESIKKLVISEDVTSVAPGAFFDFSNLTEASFPSTLRSIGSQAFDGSGIVRLELPEGLEYIGAAAFAGCPNLEYLYLPSSLTGMSSNAFSGCPKLSEIHMDGLSEEIYSYQCFSGCDSLTNLDFWTNAKIWHGCFSFCDGFTVLTIPEGVKQLQTRAFANCSNLTEVTIPSTTEGIMISAFQGCEKLETIRFTGNAPTAYIEEYDSSTAPFSECTATAYYPAGNATWTGEVMEAYSQGANITWVPYVPFRDVEADDWFADEVLWAVSGGITQGTSATTFSPEDTCTRNQVVTFLHRAMENPVPTITENPFSDVEPGDYFYTPVLWAVENRITQGESATLFGSENPCTRAQVVTFLYRAAGNPQYSESDNPFSDVESGEYYYDAVLWAVENGITVGADATHFEPDATCTRAQIVTFLYRYLNN